MACGVLYITDTKDTRVSFAFDLLKDKPVNVTFELRPPGGVLSMLSYSPKDPHIIAGGCYSGQVCWWDVRSGQSPMGSVQFENSHSEPVYKTIWTASKSGTELMTGASDGLVRKVE